jgi:hypothetical protein
MSSLSLWADSLSGPVLIWAGIAFCLSQSAMFSGLNLAFFSIGRLRLEAGAESGDRSAQRVLHLRQDANFLLCTILWGNVSVNVLLALLSDSVLAGVGAFIVSTVGITLFGEIAPQAYFSRHAIRIGALLVPIIRFYQVVLYVVAKPSAIVLDAWIGPEGPTYLREREIEIILAKHVHEEKSEISATEGRGALNFLHLDDRRISEEGVEIAPNTIFSFPSKIDLPIIPQPGEPGGDEFVARIERTHLKWAVITDQAGIPRLVLETDRYLREVLSGRQEVDVYHYCHRPIVVTGGEETLEGVLDQFVVEADDGDDLVVDRDVILYWTDSTRRIVTGADILGRLLHGIAKRTAAPQGAKSAIRPDPGKNHQPQSDD